MKLHLMEKKKKQKKNLCVLKAETKLLEPLPPKGNDELVRELLMPNE